MTSPQRAPDLLFWKLKLRYQVLLLWLPILCLVIGLVAGMGLTALALAPSLGVDLNTPLIYQSAGTTLFWTMLAVGIPSGIAVGVLAYLSSVIALAARRSIAWTQLYRDMKAGTYPPSWF